MPRLLRRGGAVLAANLLLAVVALSFAIAAPGGERIRLAAADGALAISNSREGGAIFRGENLRPGQAAAGSVRIGNQSDQAAGFTLAQRAPVAQPGAGGGLLSENLQLSVIDQTEVGAPRTVYAGPAAGMAPVDLGSFAPREVREYLFVASLPDADNSYQGASIALDFDWSARAPEPQLEPTPDPAPAPEPPAPPPAPAPAPGGPPPATQPPAPPGEGGVLAKSVLRLPSARRCVKGRRVRLRVRPPSGVKLRRIEVRVGKRRALRYRGTRRAIWIGLPRGRAVRVRVRAVTTGGRVIARTVTYRRCVRR